MLTGQRYAVVLLLVALMAGAFGYVDHAQAASCHKAYTVAGHWVSAHTVKATSKHKAYTVARHYQKGYAVKSNCPKK